MLRSVDDAATEVPEPTLRIELRKPRLWSRGFKRLLLGVAVGLFGGATLRAISDSDSPALRRLGMVLAIGLGLGLLLFALLYLVRRLRLPVDAPALVFGEDGVELPRSSEDRRVVRVPYAALLSIAEWGAGGNRVIVIDTATRTFRYPQADFVDADALARIQEITHRQLAPLPNGAEQSLSFNARTALAETLRSRPARLTRGLLATIVLPAVIPLLLPEYDELLGQVRLGASVPSLIWQGQWHRLVSANFLHMGPVHLLFNASAVFALGSLLERLLGPARLLVVYGIAGVASVFASAALRGNSLSLGASGAIFGLVGALAVINYRYGYSLPAGFRIPRRSWVTLGFINGGISLLPMVDGLAHLSGLLVGATVTWPLVHGYDLPRLLDRNTQRVRLMSMLVVAVLLLGVGQAVDHALRWGERDQISAAMSLLSNTKSAEAVNAGAWTIATTRSATQAELKAAGRALQAVAPSVETADPALIDTSATLIYRMGNTGLAVDMEQVAMQRVGRGSPFYASQLARFMRAHRETQGPVLVGVARAQDVVLSEASANLLRASVQRSGVGSVAMYAFGVRHGVTTGLLEIYMPTDPSRECVFDPSEVDGVGPGTRFELGLVVESERGGRPRSECALYYTPMAADVAVLP